ncbi:hypothetical protein GJ744_008109 [Endocarpon pusillum]|uniref:Aminoglycoside phosphotransferase domain-containing protein n=1 Tax=Endocarpon pusillum TaxID=364733 RepID=A0A8H7ALQ5_9EURO|nr:hypothetical protein GJ744_008109 [Endocarpon pusillum]
MSAQAGLKWETTLFGSQPQWTVELSIDIITKVACRLLQAEADKSVVKFLGQGAFNKTYLVTTTQGDYVMRVALPVHPRFKTLSEVAVLEYLQKVTPIPIPEVLSFDASRRNELGFEWILMNRIPGSSLSESWDSIS